MSRQLPLLLPLHRFALDDGPGIRTTVFFKGCPLSCVWCHNPETISTECEIACYPQRCISCGECLGVCPTGAITLEPLVRISRTTCTACGRCAETCPALALERRGEYLPAGELVALLLRDRLFYESSGGGVTFSGGEATVHMDYLEQVLRDLKQRGIHTALQTCGLFDFEHFSTRLLPRIDLIFYDIKLLDPDQHQRFTGRDNRPILDNFVRLTGMAREKLMPRVPLIPGITATRHNLTGIASFLRGLGYGQAELLSHNPGCREKRLAIGREIPEEPTPDMMTIEDESRCRELFFSALAGEPA
ncbi:MAG: glycyl-radical enzyme activating protein [Desulfuromonadales bacterium]|nr:glycyl-radical enzyme activating protein [Desulfuromonadales bacterium]